jgi:hypothetical protein
MAGVLKEQKEFAEVDETSEESFLNTFDEGHRDALWRHPSKGRILCSPCLRRVTNNSVGIKLFIVPVLRQSVLEMKVLSRCRKIRG